MKITFIVWQQLTNGERIQAQVCARNHVVMVIAEVKDTFSDVICEAATHSEGAKVIAERWPKEWSRTF